MIVCGFSVDVWCLVCCQPLLACSLLAVSVVVQIKFKIANSSAVERPFLIFPPRRGLWVHRRLKVGPCLG
jgi:hypothetical protein